MHHQLLSLRRALFSLLFGLFLGLIPAAPSQAAPLSYYLPDGVLYRADISTPDKVLGWNVGEWHIRHDQLVRYMEVLAEESERMELEVIGYTHQQRPLVQLMISSPENLARRDAIFKEHRRLADAGEAPPEDADLPVVVNLGYSVHGNEASGSNAAPVVAYHLAAAQGQAMEDYLQQVFIVLDPSLNPDGLSRFAHWANGHRGQVLVGDPQHREHREGWPNGRTNHYWFDLNRDWLLLQHPESRARVERFHLHRPHVLTDFHEMGSNSTYFFQPGVPSRLNPLIPARNQELTHAFAQYHAEALEKIGSLFYSEEQFDDFYFGKGSTYPDLQGSVGILFEQASARGHVQDTPNGPLSFPFAIRNQVRTSLSTLEATLAHRQDLLQYRAEFFARAQQQAAKDPLVGYVFGDAHDPARTYHLVELLRRHQIEVHALERDFESRGQRFTSGTSFVVPLAQPQYYLVRALFERRVDFADNTFYDVSTWNFPFTFGLPSLDLDKKVDIASLLGPAVEAPTLPVGTLPPQQPEGVAAPSPAYAYLFEWNGYYAPRALHRLLGAGVQARVATAPFHALTRRGERAFNRGTIVVPLGLQNIPNTTLTELLRQAAQEDGITIYATDQGLTPQGIDLGSPSLKTLKSPVAAMLVGPGVGAYEAGELWHLLDVRFGIPLSLLRIETLERLNLNRYTHLVMVDGNRLPQGPAARKKIRRFVEQGGVLVTTQRAAAWATEHILRSESISDTPDTLDSLPAESGKLERKPYAEREKDRAEQLIGGAIFRVELDLTHPLAYGYTRSVLPVFRHHSVFLEPETDPYAVVAAYPEDPLLSGYVSDENITKMGNTPAVLADRLGQGAVVRLVDDPNFRSVWYGTNKLFLNALFFGGVLDGGPR